MIRPYEGSDPYVFVSYSHADEKAVVPIVEMLLAEGYRVWYDAGIEGGSVFTARIEQHVESCAGMIAFLTPAYNESWYCQDEVQQAYEQRKHILPVVMEEVELCESLRFNLRRFQREKRSNYASDDGLLRALREAPFMGPCLRKPVRGALRALASPVPDEENLKAALDALQALPESDWDEGVESLVEQIKERLGQLELVRQRAIRKAGAALEDHGDDEGVLKDGLAELRNLSGSDRDPEVEQLIKEVENRLDEIDAKRRRHERELRARKESVDVAQRALDRDDENGLRGALYGLKRLPDSVRDDLVSQYINLIEGRLSWLEDRRKAEELRMAAEREEARRQAIASARDALYSTDCDERRLQDELHALRKFTDAGGDQDVQWLIREIENRLDEIVAEREQLEWREREVARRNAVDGARAALGAPSSNERSLRDALATLQGLPEAGEDQEAKQLVDGIEKRLDELVAGKAAEQSEHARRQQQEARVNEPVAVRTSKSGKDCKVRDEKGSVRKPNDGRVIRPALIAISLIVVFFIARNLLAKSLSSYSWSELKDIADEIAAAESEDGGLKIAKSYGLVGAQGELKGDTKSVTLADGTKAKVRIAGFRHDDRADGKGKAGITFEFADIPVTHVMNSKSDNTGGWAGSDMHTYLNGEFLMLLPGNLSSNIVEVMKATNNAGYVSADADVNDVVSEEPDYVWLLSWTEVYGSVPSGWHRNDVYSDEGHQYQLYRNQSVSTKNYSYCMKETSGGASSWWWLRSPRASFSGSFRCVFSDDDWNYWSSANNAGGVSPGFCF